MTNHVWKISLKPHLTDEQKDISPYEIAKELGMSKNTVINYMENDEVTATYLSSRVGALARYFGVDEMKVIRLEEVSEEGIYSEALTA